MNGKPWTQVSIVLLVPPSPNTCRSRNRPCDDCFLGLRVKGIGVCCFSPWLLCALRLCFRAMKQGETDGLPTRRPRQC